MYSLYNCYLTEPSAQKPFNYFKHLREGLSDTKAKLWYFYKIAAVFDFYLSSDVPKLGRYLPRMKI